MPEVVTQKRCFREPISEIFDAARYMDAAVSAHLVGERDLATKLLILANNPKVRDWTDSIWGRNSKYISVIKISNPKLLKTFSARMPTTSQMRDLHIRDGFHCRYCTLPVIRSEIRKKIIAAYPKSISWGKTNQTQHAGFQAMWAQYDHVIPHSHGGTNELDNLVVSCSACNYGKMSYTIQELNLSDPRLFPPHKSNWDGLERFTSRR